MSTVGVNVNGFIIKSGPNGTKIYISDKFIQKFAGMISKRKGTDAKVRDAFREVWGNRYNIDIYEEGVKLSKTVEIKEKVDALEQYIESAIKGIRKRGKEISRLVQDGGY